MIRALLAALLLTFLAAAHGQGAADWAKVISEQLVYPREARYTLPATLPSDTGDAARNAQWKAVAERLAKANILRLRPAGERLVLEPAEQSVDVVVPSMNLRYETTALNVVLGRWEVEAAKAATAGGTTHVTGRRRLTARTRAYAPVVEALGPREAAAYGDRDAAWEITGSGASAEVVEKSR